MGLAASKQEAFWEACGFGHKLRVRKFIDEGIDVNWVSYTHNSCAIHVASQGKKEIVQMLLDAGCDVNVKDDRGNLPMHHAAMRGYVDIMEMLNHAGSQLNVPDKNGWTSLINAAYFCQPEALEFLLKHKCDVNYENKDDRSALHETCRSPSEDESALANIIKQLIAAGADINKRACDISQEADFTPLMFACYHGHVEVARELILANCDVDAQGEKNKWTALHWAADRDHLELVELLLESGADPMLEGEHEVLAFHRCKDNEIKCLIEQSIIAARGTCETDDELDDEEDDKYDEKDMGDEKGSSELSSPVSSIPDAMEKDESTEKENGHAVENGESGEEMNGQEAFSSTEACEKECEENDSQTITKKITELNIDSSCNDDSQKVIHDASIADPNVEDLER